jgi:hypothetical protein
MAGRSYFVQIHSFKKLSEILMHRDFIVVEPSSYISINGRLGSGLTPLESVNGFIRA